MPWVQIVGVNYFGLWFTAIRLSSVSRSCLAFLDLQVINSYVTVLIIYYMYSIIDPNKFVKSNQLNTGFLERKV